ncbi:uncharacterized protein LOC104891435 [Beta vulgaris subsp. vulgaris]|uniref:uncharacterized protein LOC104891435 n=1 Tax=Beta vulgaris subsp. vulgaris TaxID=3555 RepID=UPI0025483CA3|nr:uncharacterized protein LOC104891435 [Beta vulgaris subsp. vulgaris]XP_048499195.2 uncharacterized protein LOC104891435 [Beta vulgaris subsp. vulgaris]
MKKTITDDTIVTVKFWHGGTFTKNSLGVTQYVGGEARTFPVDADELCWFYLEELAEKCGNYSKVDEIYYLVPGSSSFEEGLRRVKFDDEVRVMIDLVLKSRCIDCYVVHVVDVPDVVLLLEGGSQPSGMPKCSSAGPETEPTNTQQIRPNKLTPRRPKGGPKKVGNFSKGESSAAHLSTSQQLEPPPENSKKSAPTDPPPFINTPSSTPLTTPEPNTETEHRTQTEPSTQPSTEPSDYHLWYDDRPDSPLTWRQLLDGYETDDECTKDPQYYPTDDESDSEFEEGELEEEHIELNEEGEAVIDDLDDYETDDECTKDPQYYPTDDESDSEFEEGELEEEHIELNEDGEAVIDDFEIPECLVEQLDGVGDDTSDDEYWESRKRVSGWNEKIIGIANQLQRDAATGRLCNQGEGQQTDPTGDADKEFLSEYEASEDENHTPDEDEQDEILSRKRRVRVPVVDESTDFSKLVWKVGIRFENREKFRDAVVRFAIAQGRNLTISVSHKNRQQRLGVKCVDKCPFRLYASWDSRRASFVVKTVVEEHSCNRNMELNRQMKSSWVATQFLEVFKTRPHWPAKEIVETIRRAYKVLVKRDYAYKVKVHAHRKLHGSMKEHYGKLGSYLEALIQANPQSIFKITTDPSKAVFPPVFQRFFVCFNGILHGWLAGGRKVLCVDGCFIKTFLGGMLLSAVGRDSNDQMYPLAWAVVEGENTASWEWFFYELKKVLGGGNGSDLTLISDEAQAILGGVAKIFPQAEHRHCARHVYAHWHKTYKGDEMKLLFWKAAKSYNEADLGDALTEMEKVNPESVVAFKKYNPKVFCRAHVKTHTKCDVIVNNMAETFNGYIIHARAKHIIFMLEDIRTALMQRMVTKRQQMEKSTAKICPRIQSRLEKEKDEAANCTPLPSSATLFQVAHKMDTLTVDLEKKSCTCRKWDLSGVPCCHGVACIFFLHHEAEDYVDECYKREAYLKMYCGGKSIDWRETLA